ncbi:FUSC family protein [Kaistia defluvii]|uniref:FUSC family protein n=1 Tax=Kaistia defluvii TaxID=410841 RepID=UPI00339B8B49
MPIHRLLRARIPVRRYSQEMFAFRRGDIRPETVIACMPAIAICLAAGIVFGRPDFGLVAASGAFSVGFGAYQRFTAVRAAPMILAMAGMSAAACVGSFSGSYLPLMILFSAMFGALCGGANAAGPAAWWITLQWAIAFFVADAYPSDIQGALGRAGLIFSGGLLQIALVTLVWVLAGKSAVIREHDGSDHWQDLFAVMGRRLTGHSDTLRIAIATAILAVATTLLTKTTQIPNGYWIPVTALIILKPQSDKTVERVVFRICGTVAGAGIATLIAALLRPDDSLLAVLVVLLAGVAYSMQRSGYAAFVACVTACVVFLVALAGLPEIQVVEHRIIATVIGGLLALATAVCVEAWDRRAQRGAEPPATDG